MSVATERSTNVAGCKIYSYNSSLPSVGLLEPVIGAEELGTGYWVRVLDPVYPYQVTDGTRYISCVPVKVGQEIKGWQATGLSGGSVDLSRTVFGVEKGQKVTKIYPAVEVGDYQYFHNCHVDN